MIYSCSLIGIYSSFKDRYVIVAIGKIDFLFYCGLYLSNFTFIIVYVPLSAVDFSMLIGVPITHGEGLSKVAIDVFNFFNKKIKNKSNIR